MQKSKLNANPVGANCIRPCFEEMTLKNQKGITLIALIITIIVMLILVGVTINVALNGGLFKNAETAAKQMQIKADEEELQIEIATAYNEKEGKVNLDLLKTNLETKNWKVTKSGEDKLICTSPKGNTFTVTTDGKTTQGGTHSGGSGSVPSEGTRLISMYRAGENCEEENCTNEGHLHIGDYVSYNPDTEITTYYPDGGSETNIGSNTGYTTEAGATNLQVVEQEKLNWRVLGANGDNVLLISGAPTATSAGGINFYGHIGYNNYENILNTACRTLYSKSGIGTARSINMNDIDTYLEGNNFTKSTFDNEGGSSGYYGYTNTSITSKFDYDSENNILTKLGEEAEKTLSLTSDNYYYTASDYIKNPIKLDLLQGTNNYYYWVASRSVFAYSNEAFWCMNYVGFDTVGGYDIFFSCNNGEEFGLAWCLRPVVSISSNVTTADVNKLKTAPTETWDDPFGFF